MAVARKASDGLEILILQPGWESKIFDLDFADQLAEVGATSIASVDSVAQERKGLLTGSGDVTIGSPTSSGALVQVRISAADDCDGEDYKITARITDDEGNLHEGEGWLYVRDL